MTNQDLGLIFLPAGVLCICFAGFWQLYVMITESYTLNRLPNNFQVASRQTAGYLKPFDACIICPFPV